MANLQFCLIAGLLLVSACQSIPPATTLTKFDSQQQMLVVFNPGSLSEFRIDKCPQSMPQVLASWLSQRSALFKKEILCTAVGRGEFKHRQRRGEAKIDKRVTELIAYLEERKQAGWQSHNIILVGQSAGGWAALTVLAQRPDLAAAAIVFAPEFAGPLKQRSEGWEWLRQRRQDLIKQATKVDALVYGFDNDRFYQLQHLDFLTTVPGIELTKVYAADVSHCSDYPAHRWAFTHCFTQRYGQTIYQRLLSWQKNAASVRPDAAPAEAAAPEAAAPEAAAPEAAAPEAAAPEAAASEALLNLTY